MAFIALDLWDKPLGKPKGNLIYLNTDYIVSFFDYPEVGSTKLTYDNVTGKTDIEVAGLAHEIVELIQSATKK
ncbi:hypothetical protein [Rhizobium leguminosarum]|uniref:hypothetical protein n=1 Tax=Rhizobium leguminosarum TaxID=384 RepID=UPI0010327468|nr:hypothetical protein [Rhizobium leguminosarum]TAY37193.1 hypothetical protein ELH89_08740 [Rhizobium leguminosarum]